MIITSSPLRITLGGGGTDLPSYYRDYGGFAIAGAIDKYVYITLHDTFEQTYIIKYSQMEKVAAVRDIQHPIIREALALLNHGGGERPLELTSMADIPAGTGLGSSGSFTTALLKALHTHHRNTIDPRGLAEQACHIEIDRLGEPVGKQDQYIASFGGLNCFHFHPDGSVGLEPLRMSRATMTELEDRLLLFFTGYSRSAGHILQDQDSRTRAADADMIANLHEVKALGLRARETLEAGDLAAFGKQMDEQWHLKRRRSPSMSATGIDQYYDLGKANGAIGGKLIGAGGGGFLMFLAEDQQRLRLSMQSAGLREVRFRFDFDGTRVLAQ